MSARQVVAEVVAVAGLVWGLSLAGGAIGCALGFLVDGVTATSIVGSGQGGGKTVILKLVVDSDIVLRCMSLSVIMGMIGGGTSETLRNFVGRKVVEDMDLASGLFGMNMF